MTLDQAIPCNYLGCRGVILWVCVEPVVLFLGLSIRWRRVASAAILEANGRIILQKWFGLQIT
jgi:hypothetical protein